MKMIVCGAGRVGFGIAKELSAERNAVTVIDQSPEEVDRITTNLDVRGVVGHAGHPDVLARAGAEDAEMIIAVTHSDEVNMVACQVAHSVFDVPTKVARIRSQAYLDPAWSDLFSRRNMPIDVVISPEIEVGRAVLRRLETPGAFDTLQFLDGRVRVLGVRVTPTCPVKNTPLSQVRELFPHLKAVVAGVRREGKLFVPELSDQVLPGDDIYIVVAADSVGRALDIFAEEEEERARKVVIVGAGNIGVFVAQALEQASGLRVRMLESDKDRAEEAAAALRRTVVLHGDGMDPVLLREAGAADAEVVISLTNDDKVNVLSAALAKEQGARRAVCLVNNRAFHGLKPGLGIDVLVDPRATTISTILQHVRRGRITGLQFLDDGAAEIVEGVALETSPLIGRPVNDAGLGEGIVVGALLRGDALHMGDAEVKIKTGDRLVMFAEREQVAQVEKLFRVSLEYF